MRIYFVRHGHPDYKNDCLTALGHRQAAAAAERLGNCGIERVFASTKGRALQTAEHTAQRLGLEVIPCDFMREIDWRPLDGASILKDGHPWDISDVYASEGKSLIDEAWQTREPYCKSRLVESFQTVTSGIDAWLAELGYQREGEYYRVGKVAHKTVAMFSHGGSSSAALSHILNIPFPQLCGLTHPDFTSITVLQLSDKSEKLFYPQLFLFNDARHIEGLDVENTYGNG